MAVGLAPGWTTVMVELEVLSDRGLAPLRPDQGHGLVFELLSAWDPEAATELHRDPRDKGFRSGWLQTAEGDLPGPDQPQGTVLYWPLGATRPEVRQMLYALAGDAPEEVRFGANVLGVRMVWPGVDVAAEDAIDESGDPAWADVDFQTPTAFRGRDSAGRNVVHSWPAPRLLIEGLARRWERMIPVPLPVDLRAMDEGAVTIERWAGRCLRAEVERQTVWGGVGQFRYRLPVEPGAARAAAVLLRWAEAAGVGWRAPHGFGQVAVELGGTQRGR